MISQALGACVARTRDRPQHVHPARPRPSGSAPCCALNPRAAAKQATGRAGGASPGSRSASAYGIAANV
eukprot:7796290-Alexandrium_andersonii.AAC.1